MSQQDLKRLLDYIKDLQSRERTAKEVQKTVERLGKQGQIVFAEILQKTLPFLEEIAKKEGAAMKELFEKLKKEAEARRK